MRRTVRLKGIKVVTKPDGRRYVYHRASGVRLPDLAENHPTFIAAYAAAQAAPAKRKGNDKPGSIGALIVEFLGSKDFHARRSTTQVVWRRRLDHIRTLYGAGQVAHLTTDHIERALAKSTPGAARSERTIWRGLMKYAKAKKWRNDNPATHAEIEAYKPEPYETWLAEDIEQFRAHWPIGTGQRQAMEVLYWTAARIADAVRLGHQYVKDGVLEFEQEKTEGDAFCPITAEVADFLKEDQRMFLDSIAYNMIWITTGNGKPRTVKGLSNYISAAAKAAGLANKTAHGLRKARATMLADNGWTTHQIAAWTGHASLAEVERYTKKANRRALVLGGEQTGKGGNSVARFPK